MKVISLWQPWAQFMALGLKVNETRSWPTSFRGPIAIHAAQRRLDKDGRKLLERVEFMTDDHIHLTYGAIIAVVDLRGVHLTDSYSIPDGPVRACDGNVPSPGGEGQGEGGPKPRAATNPEPKPDAQNLLLNLRSGVQLDIFCATAQTWATLQLCRTGSKEHNIWLAKRAIDHGGHWNPYRGLFIPSPLTGRGQGEGSGQGEGGLVHAATEEDLYAALKLPYIAPENREPHFLRSLR